MNNLQNTNQLLQSLKDVEGLTGSFIVNLEGQLVGRDMPSMFDDGTLNESAPRIQRIFEALEADGNDYHTCVFTFGEFRLFVRKFSHGNLCALVGEGANLPALKMATNLITKRLNQSGLPQPGQLQSEPTQNTQPQATAVTSTQSSAPKGRMYRGVRID